MDTRAEDYVELSMEEALDLAAQALEAAFYIITLFAAATSHRKLAEIIMNERENND